MGIAIEEQRLLDIEVSKALGLRVNFQLVQDWITRRKEIKQAFVLTRSESNKKNSITAFIELKSRISNNQKRKYIGLLKNELFEKFRGHLLPCTFVFVNELNRTYSNTEFEDIISEQKFNEWEIFNTQLNYWSNTLANIPHLHNLPIDNPRQANHVSSRSHLKGVVEAETYKKLTQLCSQCNVDIFTLLQTAFSVLICRYSNDPDIIMAAKYTEVDTKDKRCSAKVFFDDLILRTCISDNPKFKVQLDYNKQVIQEAYLNSIPLPDIQERITIQENLIAQIFQIKLHYQIIRTGNHQKPNSFLTSIYDDNLRFKHDLELSITNTGQSLILSWFYNANLFTRESISRIAESLKLMLESVAASVTQPIYSLSIMDKKETTKLLLDWNNTNTSPADILIHSAFERQALLTPDNVALRFNSHSLSYQDLDIKANQVAQLLKINGVDSNSTVAVYLEESFQLIIAILGILKTGCSYMPLDTSFPKSSLEFFINDSKISTVITDRDAGLNIDEQGLNVFYMDELVLDDAFTRTAHTLTFSNKPPSSSIENAYLMYTSGSTKQPKGVLGTHKSVMNRLYWMKREYRVTEEDVFCLNNSITSVDHVADIFQPLVCGASLVILEKTEHNDIKRLTSVINRNQVTRLTLLPSTLKLLIEYANCHQLKSLNTVVSSGEPLHSHLVDSFYKALDNQKRLLNLYGSTETGADISCFEVDFKANFDVFSYFKNSNNVNAAYSSEEKPENIFENLNNLQKHKPGKTITNSNIFVEELKEKFTQTNIPSKPLPLSTYISQLKKDVMPNIVNVSSEKYIGHMTSPLPYFVPELSKFIAEANQNIVKVETAKSMTFMERQVLAMLHRLFFSLNDDYYINCVQNSQAMLGIVTSGGSLSNITALYCARNASLISKGISKEDLLNLGAIQAMNKLGYRDSVILVSQLAHYSIKKAASLLGIGQNNLLIIDQDERQKVNIASLERLIEQCNAKKKHIIAIIGIAGATETGTIDPLEEIANIAEKHKIHFHADAAWGGAFMFSEKYKHKLKGIERADSITICAHKQLYIAQGMSVCLFRDPSKLFSITTHAEYQSQKGSYDLGQFTLEGSRPAISLLLHATLHLFSESGYAQLIDQSMDKASFLSNMITKSDCFQLVGENDLNIINYRYIPNHLQGRTGTFNEAENKLMDQATDLIQTKQFDGGKTFVSKTRISYKPYSAKKITVFRVVLANPNTSYEDIIEVLQDQLRIASEYIENEPADSILNALTPQQSTNTNELVTVPIGRPIDNVKMYILDPYLNPVPIGVTGEIYVSGDCLANGYLNQESLNKRSFIPNPFCSKGGLMFKSGDLARRITNGNVEYLGRKDLQVKLKGHRIKLLEIKNQLDKLEFIRNSIVLVESDLFSENVLTAYVEIDNTIKSYNSDFWVEQIKSGLKVTLPDFMIPSAFKIYDSLPLTPNGKINFKKLS